MYYITVSRQTKDDALLYISSERQLRHCC